MKFEINPNELTTDQRAHVAAFITGWPTSYGSQNTKVRGFDLDASGVMAAEECDPVADTETPISNITEEQRPDAEQKSELQSIVDPSNLYPEANLNAIFGSPPVHCPSHVDYDPNATIPVVPLDSQGLPWDSRIHASTKTLIADGSWKLRRGVDPAEVEKVKAQLKELMAVPVADSTGYVHLNPNSEIVAPLTTRLLPQAPAPVLTPTSVGYVPPPVVFGAGPDITVVTPIPPSSVEIVPVPPAPKSHYLIDQDPTVAANQQPPTTVTLTDLIGRMSKAIAENRLTQAAVKEMCVKHGVSEFHLLGNRPDLLPLIDADMRAMGV